jgi:hypothetical protein
MRGFLPTLTRGFSFPLQYCNIDQRLKYLTASSSCLLGRVAAEAPPGSGLRRWLFPLDSTPEAGRLLLGLRRLLQASARLLLGLRRLLQASARLLLGLRRLLLLVSQLEEVEGPLGEEGVLASLNP